MANFPLRKLNGALVDEQQCLMEWINIDWQWIQWVQVGTALVDFNDSESASATNGVDFIMQCNGVDNWATFTEVTILEVKRKRMLYTRNGQSTLMRSPLSSRLHLGRTCAEWSCCQLHTDIFSTQIKQRSCSAIERRPSPSIRPF